MSCGLHNGIDAALTELEELRRLGRVKSLTRTFHRLLRSATESGTTEQMTKVESLISSVSPVILQRLKGLIQLQSAKMAAFVESLGNEPRLDHGYLLFLTEMSAKLKAVEVLESLLDLALVLRLRPQDKAEVYDELIKIYGKRGDIPNLERLSNLVLSESDRQHFTATIGRLAHFYR
ncbi:unnamed protein product [Nippostrongylus brasiliensis]|uniref:Tumor necrosis factor alpha-induced protein 8-like protein n=1 Tax=Nippostrongylus brasiliensis TaxID=27835 RepID=A0A0N4YD78_NIPBR|nr:hypothetical protein Q1695_004462 [Nippostrongylus brasiliensis]VDL78145.1 unnamed protein product [Nippostrongylus brasiliensis]